MAICQPGRPVGALRVEVDQLVEHEARAEPAPQLLDHRRGRVVEVRARRLRSRGEPLLSLAPLKERVFDGVGHRAVKYCDPAPRAGRSRRRGAEGKPDAASPPHEHPLGSPRQGRAAGTLIVIVLLYISPAKHWWQQSRTAGAEKQELRDLTEENRSLKKARARPARSRRPRARGAPARNGAPGRARVRDRGPPALSRGRSALRSERRFGPGRLASAPSASSIRSSWLYLATRSERDGAPVLIWPQPVATARSAIVVSSVSPERWDMTAV